MKLKRGDLKTKVKGSWTVIVCKDKQNVNALKNMHSPPLEGNFCDEHGKAMKPAIIQDSNRHMGYVDKNDCMTDSYSISRQTWKWTKKVFLPYSGPYHSQQLYHSCLMWFKINTLTFQTDIDEGPNTRDEKGASISDCKTKKMSPIHKPNKKT
jgi:hypothetical protein